jgi:alkylated DNA repair protein alkB homolog 6
MRSVTRRNINLCQLPKSSTCLFTSTIQHQQTLLVTSLRFHQSSSSTTTIGSSFKDAGYSSQLNTPSFGNIGNMPSPPDLGPIDTQPATNLSIQKDLQGPWIFLAAPNLEGELFVREDGVVLFRPGNKLGYGIGKLKLSHTSTGSAVAEIDLETYLYEVASKEPPLEPTHYTFVVSFNVATAASQDYKTFTMHGQSIEMDNNKSVKNITSINAAKLEPWDVNAQPNEWRPDPQVEQGFKVLFPRPFTISRLDPKKPPINLKDHKVGPISNVYYIPNYVSAEEEQECLIQNRETPIELKNQLDRRVVQEYGGTMCQECKKSFVSDANIPPWTSRICDALVKDRVFSITTFPNNVRIHDYQVGHGIAPHCDGPIYVPRVAILSLQSSVLMSFYNRRKPYDDVMEHYNDTFKHEGGIVKEKPLFSLVLEPRSLLVFDQDAYYFHPHGISANEFDSLDEEKVGPIANKHTLETITKEDFDKKQFKREHRVGVTIRNLLPRCAHEPMRAEYQMLKALKVLGNQESQNITEPKSKSSPASSSSQQQSMYSGMSKPQQHPEKVSSSSLSQNNNNKSLESKLDLLLEKQNKLENQLKEIQTLLAFNTQRNIKFETEVAGVLDHVSSIVLDVQAKVDDLTDELNKE